jgi:hypothetical protein
MSTDKRLYEVRVIVSEEKIYHVYADDEAELNTLWMNGKACEGKPARVDYTRKNRVGWKMIKNKENL